MTFYFATTLSGQITAKSYLPSVFIMGEYQNEYDKLISKNSEQLLSVCENSMNVAYNHWNKLMIDIEQYCDSRAFDIKGVKLWVNAFWNKDGELIHIVYHPKPNSKNIDYSKLSNIIADFIKEENPKCLAHTLAYTHYGSASFPVYARLVGEK
jgi:hypothetical protein